MYNDDSNLLDNNYNDYNDYNDYDDYDDNLQSLHQEQSNYIESLLQYKTVLDINDVCGIIYKSCSSEIDLNNFSLFDLYNLCGHGDDGDPMSYNGFLNIITNYIEDTIEKLASDLDKNNYGYYDVSHMLGNLFDVQEKIIQEQKNIKQQEYTNSSKEDFINETLNTLIKKDKFNVINELCDFYLNQSDDKKNLENIIEFKLTEDNESEFCELIYNDKLDIKVFELASDILKAKGCYECDVLEFSKFELITSIYNNKVQEKYANSSLKDKFERFKLIPEYKSNSDQPEYKSSINPMFVKCIKDCIKDKDLNSKIEALSECCNVASSLKDDDKRNLIDNIIKDECKDIIKGCTLDYYKSFNNNIGTYTLQQEYMKFFNKVLNSINNSIYKKNDTEFNRLLDTIMENDDTEQQNDEFNSCIRDYIRSKKLCQNCLNK